MDTMSHMGCTAHVEYDERDDIFVGRLLGIRSVIGFHASTMTEPRDEFVKAVEDCLSDSEQNGVKPEKPASGLT